MPTPNPNGKTELNITVVRRCIYQPNSNAKTELNITVVKRCIYQI
jgi:hypothetical protein